ASKRRRAKGSTVSSDQSDQQKEEYSGLLDAARKIYGKEGGIIGLYTGVIQDTDKTVADSFLFSLVYSFLHQRRLQARSLPRAPLKVLPVFDELAIGILASGFAKLL